MALKNFMSKVKASTKETSFKKAFSMMLVATLTMCMFVFGASASEAGGEVVTLAPDAAIDAAESLFAQITQTVNFANIAKVLTIGLGAVLGIWLAWWGLKKLFGMLQGVIRGGNIRL